MRRFRSDACSSSTITARRVTFCARLVQDLPFVVRQARNGIEGLRMAKELNPAFIFLDLDMPDVSGFEVLEQLKADPGDAVDTRRNRHVA